MKCVTSRHLDGTDCADLLSQNLLGLVIGGEGYVEPQVWYEEFRKCLVRDETWATKSPWKKFRLHYMYCTYMYNHVKTPASSQWKDMGRNFPTPPEGWCRFGGAAGSGLCLGGLPTGWLWLQWWHWLYGAPWFATSPENIFCYVLVEMLSISWHLRVDIPRNIQFFTWIYNVCNHPNWCSRFCPSVVVADCQSLTLSTALAERFVLWFSAFGFAPYFCVTKAGYHHS